MKRLILLLVGAFCLAGCNWMRLLEFRGQMKRLPEHAHWEERAWGRVLVFSKPVLSYGDLQGIGLSPGAARDGLFAIRYRYHAKGQDGQGTAEMIFQMEEGRLRGVSFPAVIVGMVGQENIEAFLRMAGGDSSPAADTNDITKAQVLRAVFGASPPMGEHRRLEVIFEPEDRVNRAWRISFEETQKPGIYSDLQLIIGKPGERVEPALRAGL